MVLSAQNFSLMFLIHLFLLCGCLLYFICKLLCTDSMLKDLKYIRRITMGLSSRPGGWDFPGLLKIWSLAWKAIHRPYKESWNLRVLSILFPCPLQNSESQARSTYQILFLYAAAIYSKKISHVLIDFFSHSLSIYKIIRSFRMFDGIFKFYCV